MKVTKKLLSIPPYLSTGWENVGALRVEGDPAVLVVQLIDGTSVHIPELDRHSIQQIFLTHEQYLEESREPEIPAGQGFNLGSQIIGLPIRFGNGGFEGIGGPAGMMEHDPSQSGAPDLPPEVIDKVTSVAKVLGAGEGAQVPEPVAGCNCFHCQVARAVTGAIKGEEAVDEEVSDADLAFRTWDIEEQGEKLYAVSNPLDPKEKYSVFLGEPLGCTCGEKNCEHIQAVLKT